MIDVMERASREVSIGRHLLLELGAFVDDIGRATYDNEQRNGMKKSQPNNSAGDEKRLVVARRSTGQPALKGCS